MGVVRLQGESAIPTNDLDVGYFKVFVHNNTLKVLRQDGTIDTYSTGVTAEDVEDIVGALIQAGSSKALVNYNDAGDVLTIDVDSTQIDFDDLLNKPDADDIAETATRKWKTPAEETKLGHITVTQAVDLDDMETKADNALSPSGTPVDGDLAVYNGTTSQWEATKRTAHVFGCSATEEHDDTFASNSSTSTYQTYLEHTSVVCEANKKYRIGVFIVWAMNTSSTNFHAQIQIDEGSGYTPVGELIQEAKDAGSDQKIVSSGFFYFTPTGTSIDLRLQFKPDIGGGGGTKTAYVHYGGLEWWRAEL